VLAARPPIGQGPYLTRARFYRPYPVRLDVPRRVMTSTEDDPVSNADLDLSPSSSKVDLRSNLSSLFLRKQSLTGPTETTRLLSDSVGGSSRDTPRHTWTMEIDVAQDREGVGGPEDVKANGDGLLVPDGGIDPRESCLDQWSWAERGGRTAEETEFDGDDGQEDQAEVKVLCPGALGPHQTFVCADKRFMR